MFQQAQAVWLRGRTREQNCCAVFAAQIGAYSDAVMRLAAFTSYRLSVNGHLAAVGPARTAKGYARVDEIPIGAFLRETSNRITVEVTGSYCRSLSTCRQESFLMAEIVSGGQVIACTGRDFLAWENVCRVQNAPRYSVQRHFMELWDYRQASGLNNAAAAHPIETVEPPKLLPRRVGYPRYERRWAAEVSRMGRFVFRAQEPAPLGCSWLEVPPQWGSFAEEAECPYEMIGRCTQIPEKTGGTLPVTLEAGAYAVLDLKQIECGFLALDGQLEDGELAIGFSEYSEGADFGFSSDEMRNAVTLRADGAFRFLTAEPYTFRRIAVFVRSGSLRLDKAGCVTYQNDSPAADRKTGDEQLDRICRCAERTLRHNALDLYTDCPSRERAGWLCDSFFTARAEHALFGEVPVEEAFLENYRLFDERGLLPAGMVPMCYPSDRVDVQMKCNLASKIDVPMGRVFIPQWGLWMILEIEEYVHLRGHEGEAERFRPLVEGVLSFFADYRNEFGLLEKLPGWNFVEWSKANDWTQDVSYPINFLYAEALRRAGRLFDDAALTVQGDAVGRTAAAQSFNGVYFRDHALREKGTLRVSEDSSEACQYYAALFGGIDLNASAYGQLRHLITDVFAAERKQAVPEILEANAFIGVYLRMETLLILGEYALLLEDIKAYFGEMCRLTGTLWEYRQHTGSKDHGFASYVLAVVRQAWQALHTGS